MPAYILDYGSSECARRFNALDEFTRGYLTAAFWTDVEPASDPKFDSMTLANLSDEAWAQAERECKAFQIQNAVDLRHCASEGFDYARAGHDFWLTRNGHGFGFWDRGLGRFGDRLTASSKPVGSRSIYAGDDDKLYFGEG